MSGITTEGVLREVARSLYETGHLEQSRQVRQAVAEVLAMQVALLRISAYPSTRADELTIEAAREIAKATLAYCKPANAIELRGCEAVPLE